MNLLKVNRDITDLELGQFVDAVFVDDLICVDLNVMRDAALIRTFAVLLDSYFNYRTG